MELKQEFYRRIENSSIKMVQAKTLLNRTKRQSQKFEPKTPIASDMFLPNQSGDHSAGIVLTTPTTDSDIANKKYVDDEIGSDHPHQDVQTTASPSFVKMTSTTADIAGMDISNDGTKTTFLGKTGDYNRIGVGTTTIHGLNSEKDLLITGELEVAQKTRFRDSMTFLSPGYIGFVDTALGSSRAYLKYEPTLTDFRLAMQDEAGNQFLIVNGDTSWGRNFDHGTQANPTLFIHSAINPDTDNTQWISLTHDQTDGVIKTGTGDLELCEKTKMTRTGGFAIKLTNKTGANSIAGYCVTADDSTNDAVKLVPVDVPSCIGVFLDSGVSDGSEAWVVISGIADVYYWGTTVRGYLARTGLTADTGEVSGQATAEVVPTSPFSVDKHFCEIGHCIETRTGAGLARTVLHFN